MSYLLDTTWIIEYFRGNTDVVARVQQLASDDLAASIVSVAELYEGVFRSNRPADNEQALHDFLADITIIGLNDDIVRTYGSLRAELVRQGMSLGALDSLIAATARYHDLDLLTFDTDFQRVEGLRIISA